MFSKEMIQTLYGYHYWANDRVLDYAARLEPADYFADAGYSHGSLHGILFHILRTDYAWRISCQTLKPAVEPLLLENFPDLQAIHSRWEEEQQAMLAYLSGLSSDEIEGVIQLTDRRGNLHQFKLWRVLVHVILHAMQHHSEAAALLTQYGHSPGDLDFIFYRG